MRKRFDPINKKQTENEDHIIELAMRRFPIVHSVLRDNDNGNDDDQNISPPLNKLFICKCSTTYASYVK